MYELGHVLLLLWGGQIGVVGSQGVQDSPAVPAQFLAILRTVFPKLAVPLRKEADQRSVRLPGGSPQSSRFPPPQPEAHWLETALRPPTRHTRG